MKTNSLQKNIPYEWQSKILGDLLDKLEGGGTPSKENSNYWNGSIPWASVKDVVTHNPNDTQDHISALGLENSSSRLVPKGTLIVPTRMALGHAVIFNIDVAINQDLKALYPNKALLNQYLFYWFKSKKEFIERLGSGSTVSGIQQNELKKIRFNYPSLYEQKRIISVLKTWDKAIEKLEKKIEIKKKIKKGLMRQLLTGEKRLPGFKNVWQERRLAETGEIVTGNTPPMKELENYNGPYCWATAEDFNGKYILSTRVSLSEVGKSKARFLPAGSILVTCIASIGKNAIAGVPLATNQQINAIIVNKYNNNEFIYYLLEYSSNFLKRMAGAGAMLILNKSEFSQLKIKAPQIEEQTSIANVLSTLDSQISSWGSKLTLLKDQKKYLLNSLITGEIRTPEDLVVN